jgi:DNA-binding PadR family transcriptional regulator
VLALPLMLFAPGASAAHPGTGFSVSVTASPSSGSVPLTVTFSATVSSGAAVGVTWTFGDGQTWAGGGSSALTVSHRFVGPGTYSVSALVTESTGSASGGVSVNVVNGPLVVLVSASPINGTIPFTVTYRAVVSGGTGTYTSFSWGFGDGGYGAGQVVQYTYRYAGHFTATLNVVDSANDSASADFQVVAAPPSAPAGVAGSGWMPSSVVFATAGIVGVAGVTWGVYWAGRRRHPKGRSRQVDPSDEVLALPPGAIDVLPVGPAPVISADPMPLLSAAESSSAAASDATLVAPASSSVAPTPAPTLSLTAITSTPSQSVPLAPPTGDRPAGDEPRRWSREIVAYLGGLPTLGPDDIPTLDWTQKGMSDRLGTGQNQVSNVLRRLVAAGVVIEELQHVQGQPRRLKVYRLSMRGEALAREVRRRRAGQNPNFLRRDW